MFPFPIQFQFLFRQTKTAKKKLKTAKNRLTVCKACTKKNKYKKNTENVSFCLFSHTANAKEQQQQIAPETNETHKKKISCHS